MPKVKTLSLSMNVTNNNNNSFDYKVSIFMSNKDYTFYLKTPEYLIEALNEVPVKLYGKSYKEVVSNLFVFINEYKNKFSQYNENITKRIYWKWNYTSKNGKFSYIFKYFVCSTTIVPIEQTFSRGYTGYGGVHRTMTGRENKSYFFFGDKKQPFNNAHSYQREDYGTTMHSNEFSKYSSSYNYVVYSEDIENKLKVFENILQNLDEKLIDILSKIEVTNNLLPFFQGEQKWLS